MRELPAGTVTMLFSDIEGSTALLSPLGDRYGQALSDHRALLRAARLLGAAQTARHESGMQIIQPATDLLDELLAPARVSTAAQEWDAWVAGGRALSQPEALALLHSLSPA